MTRVAGDNMEVTTACEHLYYHILLAWILLFQVTFSTEEYGCDRYILEDGYQFCFDVYDGTKTKSDCSNLCAQKNSGLPIVTSEPVNTALHELVEEYLLLDIWLGLEELRFTWHWHDDQQEVDWQGCYQDSETDRDLAIFVPFDDLTPQKCQEHCDSFNYRYYGLQDGNECWCGNSLGEYDVMDECTSVCSGNRSLTCGGSLFNQAFATHGTYTYWDDSQPNNHNNYQSCALIDHEGDLFWNDVACRELHGAVCQFPLDEEACVNMSYSYLSDICFRAETFQESWYEWSYSCRAMGGHLLHVATQDQWGELLEHLGGQVWNTSLWIGLVNREWIWLSGERLLYSNWASSRPNGPDQECVAMGDDGRWDDVTCTLRYSCVCQRDNVTRPTIPPTTTPMTTTYITTTGTTPEPTTPMPTEPTIFDQYIRWALVAISVLLFTIIIVVIACCVSLSKDKKKEEMAQSNQFNLFYGVDVGDAAAQKTKEGKDVNFVLPDTPESVHRGAAPEVNGDALPPSNGHVQEYENLS